MTNSEWTELIRNLTSIAQHETGALPAILQADPTAAAMPSRAYRIEDLVKTLASSAAPAAAGVAESTPGRGKASPDIGVGTVLKTMGLATGVGPLVMGLTNLFGGGRDDSSAPQMPLFPYSAPQSIDVEAGLMNDRSIAGVTYGQSNAPRYTERSTVGGPIQINVQAMDSRSFLEHSDEIARAVREAMLHSHSLNDVVAEL